MYSITERTAQVGQVISQDNCRNWVRRDGEITPASDEAAQYETRAEAKRAAKAAGITIAKDSWWVIVKNDDEE